MWLKIRTADNFTSTLTLSVEFFPFHSTSSLPASTLHPLQLVQNYVTCLLHHCSKFTQSQSWPLSASYETPPPFQNSYSVQNSSLSPHWYLVNHKFFFFHLLVPPTLSFRMGDRGSSVIAPRLWNELPLNIFCLSSKVTSFKRSLKGPIFLMLSLPNKENYIWSFLFHLPVSLSTKCRTRALVGPQGTLYYY